MKLKGSYTVEAAIIISLCFIMFGTAIGITYKVFRESVSYVQREEDKFDAVYRFRIKEQILDVYEEIKE